MSDRRQVTAFVDADGVHRELRDPSGPPTVRQLAALERAGALRLVEPDPANRFTKSEAAAAIDDVVAAGLLEPRRSTSPTERYDRVCGDIIAHVRAHPGCTTRSVVRAVRGSRTYVGDRVRDLLELGALVDRAGRQGPRRPRELWHPNDDAGDAPAGRSTT